MLGDLYAGALRQAGDRPVQVGPEVSYRCRRLQELGHPTDGKEGRDRPGRQATGRGLVGGG